MWKFGMAGSCWMGIRAKAVFLWFSWYHFWSDEGLASRTSYHQCVFVESDGLGHKTTRLSEFLRKKACPDEHVQLQNLKLILVTTTFFYFSLVSFFSCSKLGVSLGHLSGKKSKAQVQQCIFCGRRYSNVRPHVLCACTCFVNFRQQCTTHFSSGLDIDMSSLNIPPRLPGYRPIIALFAHEVVRPAQYFLEGVKQLQVGWSCEGLAAASRFHVGALVLPQAGVGKHNLPAEEKVARRWCGSFWGRGGRHMFGCQRRSPVGGANYARGSCRPLSKEGRRCFLSHPILPHLCPSQFWRLGRWCSFLGWLPLCWQSFSSKKASQFRMDPRCFPSHRFRSRRRSSTMSEGPQVCLCDPEPTNQPKINGQKSAGLNFCQLCKTNVTPSNRKGKCSRIEN